jgi:hypothetical protein
MPYRHAPYYVLVCIAVIIAGFWASYFSPFLTVPWQFHAHGVAASIWVLMVLVQSMSVQKQQLSLHRAVGKSSLILFPFLIGGLTAIIDLTGKGFVAANDALRVEFGANMLIGLALAIAAYVTLFYRALKYRRKVWVHSGYMLATPLILFESPFSRVIGSALAAAQPAAGPPDAHAILMTIEMGMAVELAVIAVLWWRFRDKARPFLVAAGFIVAQMLTMWLSFGNAALNSILTVIGSVPSAAVVATGMAIGAATSWAGWQAGKQPVRATGLAQPA